MSNIDLKRKREGKVQERGLYLILVAFFLFVLVALCGLVIGLGFLSTNRSRLQNIANVSSIAALDSFIQGRNPSTGDPLPYDQRRNQALSRANELILANKKLPGVKFDLGDVGLPPSGGTGGKLTLGMWYQEKPLTGPTPCGGNLSDYPCFIDNPISPTGTPFANAVKLELQSQPTNPLIAPFASVFGSQGINLNTSSIARVVQRCVVFLLDVSISTVQETHISTEYRDIDVPLYPGTPPSGDPLEQCLPPSYSGNCTPQIQLTLAPTPALVSLTPRPVSLFAYRVSSLGPMATLTPPGINTPHPCQDLGNFDSGDEFFYFCNMPPARTPGVINTPYTEHFRSDYRVHPSYWGDVFVDKLEDSLSTYVGPQPLSRFFLSFNAGLRAVNSIRSPGDKAMLYAFTGRAIGTEPIGTPPYGLTEDLNPLIQLTNVYNRGTFRPNGSIAHPVVTPNFVSRGFFPILVPPSDAVLSNSNHAQALWDAIGALSNCPDSARRSIIIATDGVPTCNWNVGGEDPPDPDPAVDCLPPPGKDSYSNYLAAEQQILGPIKDELVKRGISVTALLDSAAIQPNFINATAAPGPGTPNGEFINPEDAAANGFCAGVPTPADGSATPCPKPFFLTGPDIPAPAQADYLDWVNNPTPPPDPINEDHFAFLAKDAPQYDVKWRRPNALWGQLALDTQGVICPLFPECVPQAYSGANPPVLLPTWRAGMSTITCAPVKQDKAQQAINCVLAAIGVNPYQNVEEIPPTVAP